MSSFPSRLLPIGLVGGNFALELSGNTTFFSLRCLFKYARLKDLLLFSKKDSYRLNWLIMIPSNSIFKSYASIALVDIQNLAINACFFLVVKRATFKC